MPEQPFRARALAESFGVDPERYDRGRPAYPTEFLERLIAAMPGLDVLDVGTGTGILARQLASAGCRVLGVEPDPRMAQFAGSTGVEVEVSTFEDWRADGRCFDAVVAGTAWHWVDPEAGAAKAAEVLRHGGVVAPCWNMLVPDQAVGEAFVDAFTALVPEAPFDMRAAGNAPYQHLLDGAVAHAIRANGGFTEPEQWEFRWHRTVTRDEWLDQLPTSGALTMLDADRLAVILDRVGTAIDSLGGSFTATGTTVALVAHRNGP